MSICIYLHAIAIVIKLKDEKAIGELMIRGTIIFLTGYLGWNIDYHFCTNMNKILNPQLHAWWHVTASYSCYLLLLIVIFDRSKILGKNPKIEWVCIVLPYVGLSDESEQYLPSKVMPSAEREILMQEVSLDFNDNFLQSQNTLAQERFLMDEHKEYHKVSSSVIELGKEGVEACEDMVFMCMLAKKFMHTTAVT
ncbi:16847_t:CDS:2, partial [Dentiscutata erythropus]